MHSDAIAERPRRRCVPVSSVIPPGLALAVEQAAARELVSVSAYTRRALHRSVQADGFDLVAPGGQTDG